MSTHSPFKELELLADLDLLIPCQISFLRFAPLPRLWLIRHDRNSLIPSRGDEHFTPAGRDIPFMDPDRNLAAWLDRKLFMGHLYNFTRDPEGILYTIPAIGTTLAGVLTGHWLRSMKSQAAKAGGMFLVGIVGLCAGVLWSRWFPINKNLWTSSFVLFTAGFALASLRCFIGSLKSGNGAGRGPCRSWS